MSSNSVDAYLRISGNVDFNFYEIVFISDNLSKLNFVYETEYCKGMWLRAPTANEMLERNIETQDVDGMQALFVLYMTQLEAISQ